MLVIIMIYILESIQYILECLTLVILTVLAVFAYLLGGLDLLGTCLHVMLSENPEELRMREKIIAVSLIAIAVLFLIACPFLMLLVSRYVVFYVTLFIMWIFSCLYQILNIKSVNLLFTKKYVQSLSIYRNINHFMFSVCCFC